MDPVTVEIAANTGSQQLHTISCSECQRRKQKCSRTWPCQHCTGRKVPHLCHFASKKPSIGSEAKNGVNAARKRKGPEYDILPSEALVKPGEEHNPADALKALGYLQSDGDPLFFGMLSERTKDDRLVQENEIAIKDVPPRIYCDAIVQNYFDIYNYWYYPIYPPQFLEGYNGWWETRAARNKNKPEFTCLLLRVLACSTQCVHPDLRRRLEGELGETLQDLTQKYNDSAERLSNLIVPGVGGITQVQQLFCQAVWMKGESLFINSWHALSDAIRYAQEVGIHNEALWDGLTEFDREIRRRLWTTLYIWDRFMGMILSRPLIINDRYCSVKHPSVNLEADSTKPDLPCPHKHMELQQQLCEAIIGDFDGSRPIIRVKDAETVMAAVNKWLNSLPAVYRLEGTDTRFDKTDRYIVLQRLQTVCMGYSSIVSVLKAFLTQTFKAEPDLTPAKLRELQETAIDKSVQLMDIAQQLADLYIPDYNKYFLIVFTPFDTGALLCSAILHDTKRVLPRRNEILEMIAKALALIRRLNKVTRTGPVAESIIMQLVSRFDLTPEEQRIFHASPSSSSAGDSPRSPKRHAGDMGPRKNSDPSPPGLSPDADSDVGASGPQQPMTSTSAMDSVYGAADAVPSSATTPPNPIMTAIPNSIALPPTTMYPVPAFSNDFAVQEMAAFDFGALDGVFAWQNVNLFDTTNTFDPPGGYM